MKFIKENLKLFLKSDRMKVVLLILILISFIEAKFITSEISYINSFLYIFSDVVYLPIMIVLYVINSINTMKLFDENKSYIIRLFSKKRYYNEVILNVLFSNFIVFVIQLCVFFVFLLIFNRNGVIIDTIGGYTITNLSYTIFFILRTFMLVQMFSLISVFLYKMAPKILMWFFNLFVFISLMVTPEREGEIIESIKDVHINLGEYLKVQQYKDFGFELEISFFYILAWIIITYIVYLITSKRIKQIGD